MILSTISSWGWCHHGEERRRWCAGPGGGGGQVHREGTHEMVLVALGVKDAELVVEMLEVGVGLGNTAPTLVIRHAMVPTTTSSRDWEVGGRTTPANAAICIAVIDKGGDPTSGTLVVSGC